MRLFVSLWLVLMVWVYGEELDSFSAPTNNDAPFSVEVFVDKDLSGDLSPVYTIGESIRLGVKTSQDAYVYLFNVRATGEITQILPNNLDSDNFVRANQEKYFPAMSARYSFSVAGPTGLDKLIVVASKEKLDTSNIVQFQEADSYFARSEQNAQTFSQSLSIMIDSLGSDEWVTDVSLFYVADSLSDMSGLMANQAQPTTQPSQAEQAANVASPTEISAPQTPQAETVPTPSETTATVPADTVTQTPAQTTGSEPSQPAAVVMAKGELFIQGNVGYADVYLNGALIGKIAPMTGHLVVGGLEPGRYQLRLSAPQYADANLDVDIRPDQRTRVDVVQNRLSP